MTEQSKAAGSDRTYWLDVLERIARPVLEAAAQRIWSGENLMADYAESVATPQF